MGCPGSATRGRSTFRVQRAFIVPDFYIQQWRKTGYYPVFPSQRENIHARSSSRAAASWPRGVLADDKVSATHKRLSLRTHNPFCLQLRSTKRNIRHIGPLEIDTQHGKHCQSTVRLGGGRKNKIRLAFTFQFNRSGFPRQAGSSGSVS